MDILFSIAILIMSVVIHEVSHGYAAYSLGDPTAKYQGRLTLNPLPHIDPVGSILVPLFSFFLGGFIIGWARPVPYNPYNLSNQKWGPAMVATAGPASNIFIAVIFGLLIRFAGIIALPSAFVQVLFFVVFINILLAIFNLVPIPPLDGSKILFSFLPYRFAHIQNFLEQWGFFLVVLFIFFLWRLIFPVIGAVFSLITGISLYNFF
ncbi:MAG: site-2 protease family protein [Candidatus Niyogibacteria bacterium]|nr:site-2 protease family protein [Candidatus Niyogibacteria bacterium]